MVSIAMMVHMPTLWKKVQRQMAPSSPTSGDDLVGLPGGGGQVHRDSGGFGLGFKGLVKLFQAGQALILAPGEVVYLKFCKLV
jgi:hypothetical protein